MKVPAASDEALAEAMRAWLASHGVRDDDALAAKVTRCVEQLREALAETGGDGASLSPLDVARIRLGKFAATLVPPSVFRDATALAALRRGAHELAAAYVGPEGRSGSRFGG